MKASTIVLKARMNYVSSITSGNEYVPVCQTKTGFRIVGDDGIEIDLYLHFFMIGIKTDSEVVYMTQSNQLLDENLKDIPAPAVEESEEKKSKDSTSEPKKPVQTAKNDSQPEKLIPSPEPKLEPKSESVSDHDFLKTDPDDDF